MSSYRRLGRAYALAKLADPNTVKPRELDAAQFTTELEAKGQLDFRVRGRVVDWIPSGTPSLASEVLEIVALRAGSHPGMHTVGFDGPGESLQVKVEARDRSAYVAGALLAADALVDEPERSGITAFTDLVRERTA